MLRSLPERERDRAFSPHFCLRVLQELQRVAWDSLWITVFDCYVHVWCPSFTSCQIDNDTYVTYINILYIWQYIHCNIDINDMCLLHGIHYGGAHWKLRWMPSPLLQDLAGIRVDGATKVILSSLQLVTHIVIAKSHCVDAKSQQLRFWDCKS